ncbi:MAG TPA: lactate utilization protein [Desulfovibrio sp.]|nr:lactate utilization protein [Desulfovibrio sp.]
MSTPIDTYWRLRLIEVAESLRANNFAVSLVDSCEEAGRVFLDDLLPASGASSVSFGGSMTLVKCGVPEALRQRADLQLLDTFDKNLSAAEMYERRRQSLLVDMFLTGTNAVTMDGKLINLDMIGNRVGAINFGPRNVVLFVGRNKVVDTVEDGMRRIKEYASPVNAIRLDKKTPCKKTAQCMDCKSPDRICNVWTITEKCFPSGRVHVILINEDAGY